MYIKSFKELIVWQRSMQLVKEIYIVTSKFPKFELYGLVIQIRRAAISIVSNIAEGKGRKTKNDFLQFLRIAFGSALELEAQILIAKELYQNINYSRSESLLIEVQKMLMAIMKKLENN